MTGFGSILIVAYNALQKCSHTYVLIENLEQSILLLGRGRNFLRNLACVCICYTLTLILGNTLFN